MSGLEEVLFEARGALGLITLNRPKALNALTLDMIHAMSDRLAEWAESPNVDAVLIQGAGEKAFCAGGDIRALFDAGEAGMAFAERFFRDEYRLNRTIFRYPKPYIALIDGFAMGGGVGVSVHGSHRIVTENTKFAMPETSIGMFPDVGGSYFLPRCPGGLGLYLGLTGARLDAADCVHAGIGDAYLPADRHDELIATLADGVPVDDVLKRLARDPGPSALAERRPEIDRCFAGASVEDILEKLESDGSEWARQTRETLLKKSPFAMKVALRQLMAGAELDFEDCMVMEYRISQRFARSHDFREGVRAVIIDKDQNPQWDPATLAEVQEETVAACFAPLDGRELTFPE